MRKNILPPAIAVIGGIAGFFLRKWQLDTGFEAETGLAIPGSAASVALLLCTALVALAVFVLCFPHKDRLPWDRAFSPALGNQIYLTAAVLAAFLLLVSGVAEVMSFPDSYMAAMATETFAARTGAVVLLYLRTALSFAALPCALLWARALYQGGDGGKESLPLLCLCLLFCSWLISDFQRRAADPVVMDYLYEVFAIVCVLLGVYFIAGYSFQVGKPRRTLFFCLMGAYFSLVTLADGHTLADLLRCGFAVLFLPAHALLILNAPPAEAPPAEAEMEVQDHG